ncbi:MAG TPA: hypothetical protein PKZ52_07425 [Cellvibrionaceae bacterium]|nr:hypothetical protein [Cellvibrionaceae bacterium]
MIVERLPFESEQGEATPKSFLSAALHELEENNLLGNVSVYLICAMEALDRGVAYSESFICKDEIERCKEVLNRSKR